MWGKARGHNHSNYFFSPYINDLVNELNSLKLGVPIDDDNICALLYADDIIVLSGNETNLQTLLDAIHVWCSQWRLK